MAPALVTALIGQEAAACALLGKAAAQGKHVLQLFLEQLLPPVLRHGLLEALALAGDGRV